MLLNCKFCGGELEITHGVSVTTCKYCHTAQTLPKTADEGQQGLFNRANSLRRRCDFSKAEAAFEKIIEADGTESEAYWGLVLCKYGIEYVEDPATGKMIPTCHRASYDSVIADEDYKSAIEHADDERKALYEEQAHEIDRIQKEIIALAQKEETYDVFICYKETDENGKKTRDSILANELYYQYTQEGFKVFYAAITLEGKLGKDYEPIIFAALNSAKVMLVVGSKPEYFNAVWVKNEWSRYLKIIKKDRKKLLIPCYRDMDAYDLPDEFAHLQAQDMNKFGSSLNILNGINRVMESYEKKPAVIVEKTETLIKEKETLVKEPVINSTTIIREQGGGVVAPANGGNASALIRRAFIFLEDGDFESADEYCEKVLDNDPENAEGYLGKLMIELKVKTRQELKGCKTPFDGNPNFKKILRYGNDAIKAEVNGYIDAIKREAEEKKRAAAYSLATEMMSDASKEADYKKAADMFASIKGYKDTDELIKKCIEKSEIARKDYVYSTAISKMGQNNVRSCVKALTLFETIADWKDVSEKIPACKEKIEKLKAKAEEERIERERLEELARIEAERRKKRNKKIALVSTPILCLILAFIIVLNTVIIPSSPKSLEYTLSDDETYYIVTGIGNYAKKDLVIPTKYKGKPVSAIGKSAFYGCGSLTSVMIPDSVTDLGAYAFYDCSGLKSVTIPDSVTNLGAYAFSRCNSLTSITIPDSVTNLGANAFSYCNSLTSITIPDSVTNLGACAFYDCSGLKSVTIPDSVTSIGAKAFDGCSSLTSVTFKDTSAWYRTTSVRNWNNKTGGTQTTVTSPSTNATYFTSTYRNYYWYKL